MRFVFLSLLAVLLSGCPTRLQIQIDDAIYEHKAVSHKVNLGEDMDKVLAILLPTQEKLPSNLVRIPDRHIKGKDTIIVYYIRSGRNDDGIATDDEYTPYIFTNRKLTGIGWSQLGGAKGVQSINLSIGNRQRQD